MYIYVYAKQPNSSVVFKVVPVVSRQMRDGVRRVDLGS